MGQSSGFFDAEELVDGGYDREYIAEQWANYFNLFIGNGVFSSPTNQLKVVAYTGMHVKVSVGWAFINGYWYHNDTELDLEIPANVTASTRTDGIFVQWDSSERRITAIVGEGRTSVNRIAPYYELKLAEVVVATGATAITDAVITDTRADSSVCGFVTGVIDVIDSTNLFAQFTSIFNEWFEAMREQAITDKEDWDEWYAALQEELHNLPPESAEYLQVQIDELKESGLSGSIINISTINSSLQGKTITITSADGQEVRTGTFDSNLKCTINGFKSVGTATITASDGLETATSSLTIQYFSNYNVALAFWSATVNIHTTNSALFGKLITITKDGSTIGTTSFNSSGEATFTATEAGTYTFTCEGSSVTLNVTEETTYNVYISAGLDLQDWLTAGGVTGTYNTFADVEADEEAVRKLMTIHDAVDYLAQSDGTDELISDVINSDICAKWINLRDYALDTLSANADIKALMDTADKYGYGELVLEGQVPTMTSNTAPYGEVINNNQYHTSQYAAFRAFDNGSQGWLARQTQPFFATGDYVGYDFKRAIKITEAKVTSLFETATGSFTIKIQASVNGTDWTDISDVETITNSSSNTPVYFKDLQNVVGARYYRVYVVTNSTSNGYGLKVQFYAAYQPKGNVPIMTSNTAPYGAVTSSDGSSNAYIVFDGASYLNSRIDLTGTDHYITYKFANPICVKAFGYAGTGQATGNEYYKGFTAEIEISNDGTNWESVHSHEWTKEEHLETYRHLVRYEIDNDKYALYARFRMTTNNYTYQDKYMIGALQFYGREMKVSVPTMTSNTAPWGEVSADGFNYGNPYNAFDKNYTGDYWAKSGNTGWLKYKFPNKVNIRFAKVWNYRGDAYNSYYIKAYTLYGSNDDVNYEELISGTIQEAPSTNATSIFETDQPYQYYRLNVESSSNFIFLGELELFGFDYSEYDWDTENPRHYLYDHGVELETIILEGNAEKQGDEVYINVSNASGVHRMAVQKDLTNYSLIRAVFGLNVLLSDATEIGVYATSDTSSADAYRTIISADLKYNGFVDISSINASKYVGVGHASGRAYTDTLTVQELWLE